MSDPFRYGNCYSIPEHPVAGRIANPFSPSIREALKAFAFGRGEAADDHAAHN